MTVHIFDFLLYVLAGYGLWILAADVFKRIKISRRTRGTRMFLTVKNEEDTVEGTLRTLMGSGLPQGLTENGGLFVMDCGSTDATPGILRCLSKELDSLYICDEAMTGGLLYGKSSGNGRKYNIQE